MKIFMFHDVRDAGDFFPKRYAMPYFLTRQRFKDIVGVLRSARLRHPSLRGDRVFPRIYEQSVDYVFTFDDGLRDHLHVARFLADVDVRACFFVPVAPMQKRTIIDSHKIQFILAGAGENSDVSDDIIKNYEEVFQKSSSDSKSELASYWTSKWKNNIWDHHMVFVTRILREYPDRRWRKTLVDKLFSKYVTSDTTGFADEFYLSERDVREIISLGHLVGGHGYFSHDLRFEDSESCRNEITFTKDFLVQLGVVELLHAYANGGFTSSSQALLERLKFDYCFTTENREVTHSDFRLTVPRVDGPKFFAK